MKNWLIAYQLNKWEIKESMVSILFTYLATIVFFAFFIKEMPSYLDNGTILFDLLFLLVFGASPLFPKPKRFETQHLQGNFLVSPIVLLQKQLPIQHDVITKGRILIHSVYTLPILLICLSGLYVMTPLQDILTIGSYISFATMWLSFSFYMGYIIPRLSIGARGFWTTNSGFSIVITVIVALVFLGLSFEYVLFENGIVYWTIMFAKESPLFSATVSIMLAFIGYRYWKYKMLKTLRTIMYS
ncbi:hypothetical protein [Ornithinibacillus scapharcae]|uniref:hypothetical protein n=1 Tax=Ornithinibacillus scapharcae TaxID=1147159 RepID=UPI000225B11F|nr:hypothetical protein [Ornithinibacillus scapharcae]